ncbi:MAG: hypothetical protein JKY65_29070 [Planctomycetes bacterium]|nr:hypothetical protein [Planctomycetota bacterium]
MIKRVLLVLSLLLVGCPKPPPPTVMVVPASQPAVAVLPAESPPPAVTRASFALTPGTTQTATTTGAVPHTVEIKLLRIALIECTSETLAQESLPKSTVEAALAQQGAYFLACDYLLTIDGKVHSSSKSNDESPLKGLGPLVITYEGQPFRRLKGGSYIGPSALASSAFFSWGAVQPRFGDGTYRVSETVTLKDGQSVTLEFSGEVKAPAKASSKD